MRKLGLYYLQAQFLYFRRESVGVKAIRRKQRLGEERLEMVFVTDASEPLDSGHQTQCRNLPSVWTLDVKNHPPACPQKELLLAEQVRYCGPVTGMVGLARALQVFQ